MAPLSVLATEQWFLMSRHGECAEVKALQRKIPDLGEISDPDVFTLFMRQKGYAVLTKQLDMPIGQAHEVNVPEKELSLIFVTQEICRGFADR